MPGESAPPRLFRQLLLGCTVAICVIPTPASSQETVATPRDYFGGIGLIDMPSARMAPDGQLSAGGSFFENTQRYNLGFQALPWMETSFRYSGFQHFDPSFPVFYDRSFAVKARLWNETDLIPAVAIGSNDLIGTGVYSGEYLVASKQFGDVDVTVGMGWGRLGTANTIRNPLTLISSYFDKRTNTTTGVGQFTLGDYFRGPAGIFGGAVWQTPIENLSLIAEYSSDAYVLESARGNFSPRSQLNLGLSYHAFDELTFGVDWLYGRSFGFNASVELDPTRDVYPVRLGPDLPAVHIRTQQEQQEALNRLLDAHGSVSPPRETASRSGALADMLWSNVRGIDDVSLKGRALLVTVTDNDTRRTCEDVTRVASFYGTDIDTVAVARVGGRAQPCTLSTRRAVLAPAIFNDNATATQLGELVAAPPVVLTIDAAAPPVASRRQAIAAIRADVAKQRIGIQALSLTDSEAVIYYSNSTYFHESAAVDRLTRVLMADAPPDIEKFRIVSMWGDRPQEEFDVLRTPTERSIDQTESYSLLAGGNSVSAAPMNDPVLAEGQASTFPRFSWSIFPNFRQELFDPSNPFAVQLVAGAEATLQLFPGFAISGEVEGNIYDNFNVDRPSDSVLPHVRTDFLKFFTQGKNGIGDLLAGYRFRLAPDVFAVAKVGYLESMYAGGGGEILWSPQGQRWALGADLYDVRERDFDRLFGLQPYHVVTGHVSLYYASPWYDLNFALRAGRYLAGDNGFTFEISRRFDTGVEIGVFVTKTNVTAAQFGEGSFDKGISIRIPLNWAFPVNTQREFALDLRPTQRDGGQRLAGDATLFEETRRSSYGEIRGYSDDLAAQ